MCKKKIVYCRDFYITSVSWADDDHLRKAANYSRQTKPTRQKNLSKCQLKAYFTFFLVRNFNSNFPMKICFYTFPVKAFLVNIWHFPTLLSCHAQ